MADLRGHTEAAGTETETEKPWVTSFRANFLGSQGRLSGKAKDSWAESPEGLGGDQHAQRPGGVGGRTLGNGNEVCASIRPCELRVRLATHAAWLGLGLPSSAAQ